jgi:hypothetical protein
MVASIVGVSTAFLAAAACILPTAMSAATTDASSSTLTMAVWATSPSPLAEHHRPSRSHNTRARTICVNPVGALPRLPDRDPFSVRGPMQTDQDEPFASAGCVGPLEMPSVVRCIQIDSPARPIPGSNLGQDCVGPDSACVLPRPPSYLAVPPARDTKATLPPKPFSKI